MNLDVLARYGPSLVHGLGTTLTLVAVSIACGGLLAIPVALARLSENRVVGSLAFAYVYFFRGTPLLAQIFLVYYGMGEFRPTLQSLGLWSFFRDAVNCAAFTFTLNTAAYQAEIYRGAIRSVPRGQAEAAEALGLRRWTIFRYVIAPQAAIIALRPLGNEIILMIKGSAVASIVTVLDLMGETRLAFSRSFDMTVYLYAAVLYLAVVEVLRRIWNMLEVRLTRHLALRA
ncbi:ABC transporter permease subunit [Propylenella binzhouense]|uniref:ABC transporter permease n=1 Tax=Propylenella binzhouense TaxID=2555902 RepID=A0A964WVG4_9HYPH|nr:ABC transporter permease [Propylenella binzhouense]